jgi:hypothetical protein
MTAVRKMIVFCSLSSCLVAADLKVFVSGNDTGADVLRKAVSGGKVKCVKSADSQTADGELSVKTQVIASPVPGAMENSYVATLTTPSGEILWSDHSTSGLGLLAKHLSSYACGVNHSTK